jgi:hypothetical protein
MYVCIGYFRESRAIGREIKERKKKENKKGG